MKVISSFRDYYDVMRSVDRDPVPTFVRTRTRERVAHADKARIASLQPFWDFADFKRVPWGKAFHEHGVRPLWLAFCGKAYFFYRWDGRLFPTLMELEAYVRSLEPDPLDRIHWAAYDRLTRERGRLALLEDFDKARKGKPRAWHWDYPNITEKAWERSGIQTTDLPVELFRQEGAPYFRFGSDDVEEHASEARPGEPGRYFVKCPVLSGLGLQRVWDPFWVWQELDMFLGNQMAVQFDPASARTDELALHYHGFDEHSFKNVAPGERKARRRANKERKRSGGEG